MWVPRADGAVSLRSEVDTIAGWDTLASASPLQSADWASACAAALGPSASPCFLVAGSADRPTGIAPLVLRTDRVRRVELIGLREVFEPMDLLWREPDALEALAAAMVALRLPIVLGRIPAGSPTVAAITRAFRGRGVVAVRATPGAPYLDLDARDAEPEHRLNQGRRSDLRRMQRRAAELGEVRLEFAHPDPTTVGATIDEFLEVEQASWKARAGTALAQDAVRGALFRTVATRFAARGQLRCAFLRIDGRAAAAQLALERSGRIWLFKVGYDERFARCSPGTLLLRHAIAEAAARGLHGFELLGGPEPWLQPWITGERPCVSLRAWPARGSGAAALLGDASMYLRNHLIKR